MSASGAAPALALVAPGPARPLPAPAGPLDPARRAKVRRVLTAASVTGALLPVPCVAAAPYLGDWVALGLLTGWVFLVPCGGLGLLLATALWRTRDEVRALVLAGVSLVIGLALIAPAARAGTEAYVSSHAAELDALAAERVGVLSKLAPNQLKEATESFRSSRQAVDLRRLGLTSPSPVRGGVRFETLAPFIPALLYADPAMDHWPRTCSHERVTPIGGRWFLYECHDRSPTYDDW